VPYIGRFIGDGRHAAAAYAVRRASATSGGHGLTIDTPAGAALDAEIAVVRKRVVVGGRGILEADSLRAPDVESRGSGVLCRMLAPGSARHSSAGRSRISLQAGSDDGLLACELIRCPEVGAEFPAWMRIHGVTMLYDSREQPVNTAPGSGSAINSTLHFTKRTCRGPRPDVQGGARIRRRDDIHSPKRAATTSTACLISLTNPSSNKRFESSRPPQAK